MEISKCFCRTQHDVFYNQSAKNFILFNTWERRQIITKQKKNIFTVNFQQIPLLLLTYLPSDIIRVTTKIYLRL